MLHARIAARAFNTPLLVEPAKAMAFLSGLGPRVLGRRVEVADSAEGSDRLCCTNRLMGRLPLSPDRPILRPL